MKTLYALTIAIDNYPIPAHRLQGCVNDATAFCNYLNNYCKSNGINFVNKQLFDTDAKRADVGTGFGVFEAAQDNDICILYYSGHGSQMPAAPEAWDASNGKFETIVCYDSRLTDGRDLINKELGYLIWKATKNKNIHFLAIMDCCHSGSNTRGLDVRSRMAEPGTYTPKSMTDFVGFQDYVNFQPPGARYIHLAAAKDEETAKEYAINSTSRGVFTYSLIETLQETGGLINYSDLIQRVRLKVRNRVVEQTPQMNPYGAISDVVLSFLGELRQQGNFIAGFDNKDGWIANIGGVQGVSPDTVFSVENITGDVPVIQVLPNFSKLYDLSGADEGKQYNAKIKNWGTGSIHLKKRVIAFCDKSETSGVQMFNLSLLQNPQTPNFIAVPEPKGADYLIRAWDNTYRLTTPDTTVPLFRRVQGYTNAAAVEFIEDIKTVVNWRNRLELNNPTSTIPENAISITFFDALQQESKDRIFKQADSTKDVVMMMCMTNRYTQPLYVSCVYFAGDFCITNQFMPNKFLNPGETAWLEFDKKREIPLYIQKEFLSWGVNTLKEYFKIFVSTDQIDTYIHNQDGLPLDMRTAETKRAIGHALSDTVPLADWRCFDIDFTTVCPLPSTMISGSRNIDTINVPIETPFGFSAVFTPTASEYLSDFKTNSLTSVPPKFPFIYRISSAGITESLNNTPKLDILILENIVGELSKLQPLKVKCPFYKDKAMIVAYGFDTSANTFSPIGPPSANGDIIIEKLFPAKDAENKSFIFFKQITV